MRCGEALELLESFLDDELDPDRLSRLRLHLRGCLQCARELRAAKELRQGVAGLPETLQPQRDLWPEIRERIEGESRVLAMPRKSGKRIPVWAQLAAAAVALAALSVPLSFWWIAARPDAPATSSVADTPAVDRSALATWAREEDGVLGVRRDLEEVLESRRERLQAGTVAALEEDMEILNRAVGEVRGALEQRPHDRRLQLRLASLYRLETQLLLRLSRA